MNVLIVNCFPFHYECLIPLVLQLRNHTLSITCVCITTSKEFIYCKEVLDTYGYPITYLNITYDFTHAKASNFDTIYLLTDDDYVGTILIDKYITSGHTSTIISINHLMTKQRNNYTKGIPLYGLHNNGKYFSCCFRLVENVKDKVKAISQHVLVPWEETCHSPFNLLERLRRYPSIVLIGDRPNRTKNYMNELYERITNINLFDVHYVNRTPLRHTPAHAHRLFQHINISTKELHTILKHAHYVYFFSEHTPFLQITASRSLCVSGLCQFITDEETLWQYDQEFKTHISLIDNRIKHENYVTNDEFQTIELKMLSEKCITRIEIAREKEINGCSLG